MAIKQDICINPFLISYTIAFSPNFFKNNIQLIDLLRYSTTNKLMNF